MAAVTPYQLTKTYVEFFQWKALVRSQLHASTQRYSHDVISGTWTAI